MKQGDRVQTPAHGPGIVKQLRGGGMVDVSVAGGQTVRVSADRLTRTNGRRRNGEDFLQTVALWHEAAEQDDERAWERAQQLERAARASGRRDAYISDVVKRKRPAAMRRNQNDGRSKKQVKAAFKRAGFKFSGETVEQMHAMMASTRTSGTMVHARRTAPPASECPSCAKVRCACETTQFKRRHPQRKDLFWVDDDAGFGWRQGKEIPMARRRRNWAAIAQLKKAFPNGVNTNASDAAVAKQLWGNRTFRLLVINRGVSNGPKDYLEALEMAGVAYWDDAQFYRVRDLIVQKVKKKANPRRAAMRPLRFDDAMPDWGRKNTGRKKNTTATYKVVQAKVAKLKVGAYVYGKNEDRSQAVYFTKRKGGWYDADGIKVSAARVATQIASRVDWPEGRLYVAYKKVANPKRNGSKGGGGKVGYVMPLRSSNAAFVATMQRSNGHCSICRGPHVPGSHKRAQSGTRKRNGARTNTHFKVGTRVSYIPLPGVYGVVTKASKGDTYSVQWATSGQIQHGLAGGRLKRA
jgi:hypothetical protein